MPQICHELSWVNESQRQLEHSYRANYIVSYIRENIFKKKIKKGNQWRPPPNSCGTNVVNGFQPYNLLLATSHPHKVRQPLQASVAPSTLIVPLSHRYVDVNVKQIQSTLKEILHSEEHFNANSKSGANATLQRNAMEVSFGT